MNSYTYVYCTECVHGEELINAIVDGAEMPIICNKCYPYNPEDSFPFEIRRNYQAI